MGRCALRASVDEGSALRPRRADARPALSDRGRAPRAQGLPEPAHRVDRRVRVARGWGDPPPALVACGAGPESHVRSLSDVVACVGCGLGSSAARQLGCGYASGRCARLGKSELGPQRQAAAVGMRRNRSSPAAVMVDVAPRVRPFAAFPEPGPSGLGAPTPLRRVAVAVAVPVAISARPLLARDHVERDPERSRGHGAEAVQ